MKYNEVNINMANKIINERVPIGKFWLKENDNFIAIDNSTGDAWTEEFETIENCEKYLDGEEVIC